MKTSYLDRYRSIKAEKPDELLLLRIGDFYEAMGDDAIEIAKRLNLTLTTNNKVPLAGIPYHSINKYVSRMIEGGYDGRIRLEVLAAI